MRVVFLFAILVANPLPAGQPNLSTRVWIGPDGDRLPFRTEDEALEFLRTAQVMNHERLSEGVNHPYKVLLERDGVRANAVFRDVRIQMDRRKTPEGIQFDFRDDAGFEVAAYELSRLLGLNLIPPTVERRILGKTGSLQLWIEDALTEKRRSRDGLKPENGAFWLCQYDIMAIFDNLIGNEDRNQGNMLFDRRWNRWLIDHTRAFGKQKTLRRPDRLARCGRDLWTRLKLLNREELERALGKQLSPGQVDALLIRRDLIVEYLQARIDQWGEGSVLVGDCFG